MRVKFQAFSVTWSKIGAKEVRSLLHLRYELATSRLT